MTRADVLRAIRRGTRIHGVGTDETIELSPRQRQLACESGVLTRVHRGVYVDPSAPVSPLQDLRIATEAAGYLASGWARSAAAVWGLIDDHPSRPEIVIPYRRKARVSSAVVHRSRDLCWDHVMVHDGVRVTKPLITAVDLGVPLNPMDLAEVLIRARQLKLFEPSAVSATVERLSRCGRTGLTNARAAVELVMIGDRPADSVLELRFHHGPGRFLPPYEYQHPVEFNGKRYAIDFAYPLARVAIEVDGYDKRRSSQALDYDGRRSNALTMLGWTIVRFSWTRVCFEPGAVASEILAVLGNRGHAFGG